MTTPLTVAGLDDPAVRAVLAEIAGAIPAQLGDLFVGLYLEGSFAWGTEIPASDIDLRVVATAQADAPLRSKLLDTARALGGRINRTIDLQFDVFADLSRVGAVRFQHAVHVAGRDVRPLVPLKSLEAFAHDSALSARRLATGLRRQFGQPADFPLGYPDPTAEFLGYETQRIQVGNDSVPSTKRLVTNILAVATAFVAGRGRTYVPNKHQVAALYAQTIGDDWSGFIEEVYATYRTRLGYTLPTRRAERRDLTSICERATDFENRLMLLDEREQ